MRLSHRFIEMVVRCLLQLIYRGPGEQLPPIQDLLLLDSASALAYKIRTRKIEHFLETVATRGKILEV
uniref:(California timema) hypothetical protein n=1 Tax=Timema californicum TaxID=61474 RepID=A0A7R9JEG4_TIMCA|nr:unnamed protein product [Timema californicum]